MFGFASRLLSNKDLAKDVTQELYLRLWTQRKNLHGNIKPLAYKILKNICIDQQRRDVVQKLYQVHGSYGIEEGLSIIENIENREIIVLARKVLYDLPIKQRLCIELKDFCDFSYKEVSEILAMDISAVHNNVSRARRRIQEILKDLK